MRNTYPDSVGPAGQQTAGPCITDTYQRLMVCLRRTDLRGGDLPGLSQRTATTTAVAWCISSRAGFAAGDTLFHGVPLTDSAGLAPVLVIVVSRGVRPGYKWCWSVSAVSMAPAEGQSGMSGGQLGLLVSLLSFLGVAVLLAAGLLYWRGRRLKSDSLTYTTFTGPFGDRKVTISTKVSQRSRAQVRGHTVMSAGWNCGRRVGLSSSGSS